MPEPTQRILRRVQGEQDGWAWSHWDILFATGVRGFLVMSSATREFHLQIRDLPRLKSEMGVKLQHM